MKNKRMFNPISAIFYIIISLQFLFSISNGIPPVDDKMLIDFVKGHQEMQISEYSKQKYEAHLGIMHYMKNNWKWDKIDEKFEEYERTECQKYRKYLDILYEYLRREYAGIPTVKPKFVFKIENIEIDGSIIYAVNCLVIISRFYFDLWANGHYNYKLNKLFNVHYKPNFLNEKRLNYFIIKLKNEQKLSINEMLLQLAIDTANECQTNENLDGILRENFEKNLEEMLKRAVENWKKEHPRVANEINENNHKIILDSKFYDNWIWTKDAVFCEFVKGQATNLKKYERFCEKFYDYDKLPINLGIVYLMRENWHCDKIGNEFKEECQKYRKFLQIFYEFLFRIYVEAYHLPAVKPIITADRHGNRIILTDVVKKMNEISKFFFNKNESALKLNKIKMENEEELNYEIKEDKSGINLTNTELETQIAKFRKEFERKMEILWENAKAARAKLEKAKSEIENDEEKRFLDYVYKNKFGTFDSSPFS